MKEIHMLVGMKHRGMEKFVAELPKGEVMKLVRERTNPYDKNAVQVHVRENFVGFLRANTVRAVAIRMDAEPEREFVGRLTFSGEGWPMVEIETGRQE